MIPLWYDIPAPLPTHEHGNDPYARRFKGHPGSKPKKQPRRERQAKRKQERVARKAGRR